MALSITPAAHRRINESFSRIPNAQALRVGVRGCECEGFSYFFQVEQRGPQHDDQVFRFADNVQIYIDKKSYFHLSGTELDVTGDETRDQFVLNKLLQATGCSCEDGFLQTHPDGR